MEFKDGKLFDGDKEVSSIQEDFSYGMMVRIDDIDNATYKYLSELAGKPLSVSTDRGISEVVGEVLEFACNSLIKRGYNACYPYRTNSESDKSPIIEYLCTHSGECDIFNRGECKYKDEPYEKIIEYKEDD